MSAPMRRLSIRQLIRWLSVVFLLLTVALLLLVRNERINAESLARAEYQRYASYQAAIELMQTSNDLTRMARLYVSTGEARYAQYYERILGIRAGRAPRPQAQDPFYWDRVLAGTETLDDTSPPRALLDILRELQFTDRELASLTAAQAESEKLAKIEEVAMGSIAAKAAKGAPIDNSAELAAMVDADYHDAKGRIMAGIQRCLDLVDARTKSAVQALAAEGSALRRWLFLAVIAELALALALVGLIARLILKPVNELVGAAQAVAREDYDTLVAPQRTLEFSGLAEAFNQMTAAISRDITRRKATEIELAQARDAAEAATRAKSVFLATMSHEIRTPMIGVTGMLEVLSYSPLNADQRREVAVIQQSAQSLLTIIADILDFSKIEAGRMELAPTTISLREVVNATSENFMPAASSVGLRLNVTVDPRVAPAHEADPVRIRQILSNFLSNAMKFTHEGGIEVTVTVERDEAQAQSLVFAVKDSGIGISDEAQKKLFQPFQQAESGTTRKYGGTGLGLTIARRLAELMGGDITMQSAVGVGTTMFLRATLPIGDVAQLEANTGPKIAHTRQRPATREAALAEGSLLLLAEDHPTNRLVLARQFDLAGFWIDVENDGALAFAKWQTVRYAAVFTDLHMPNMDGLQLTEAIRAAEAARGLPRMPVLALTAAAMKEDAERCLAAGMDDVIIKPTTVPVLAAKLKQWLPQLRWAPAGGANPAASAATAAPAAALIDQAVLDALSGGDAQMARDILADFVESTRSDVAAIPELMARREAGALTRQAHRIKGAARMVGAAALAEAAERMETAGRDENWPALTAAAPEIGERFAALEKSLPG